MTSEQEDKIDKVLIDTAFIKGQLGLYEYKQEQQKHRIDKHGIEITMLDKREASNTKRTYGIFVVSWIVTAMILIYLTYLWSL